MVKARRDCREATDRQVFDDDRRADIGGHKVNEQLAEDNEKGIPLETVDVQRTAEARLDDESVHFKKRRDDQRLGGAPNLFKRFAHDVIPHLFHRAGLSARAVVHPRERRRCTVPAGSLIRLYVDWYIGFSCSTTPTAQGIEDDKLASPHSFD